MSANIDELKIFIAEDGSEIAYYLDENGKFSLIAHNTLKSCTIKIFTTPYATGGTIPQI